MNSYSFKSDSFIQARRMKGLSPIGFDVACGWCR